MLLIIRIFFNLLLCTCKFVPLSLSLYPSHHTSYKRTHSILSFHDDVNDAHNERSFNVVVKYSKLLVDCSKKDYILIRASFACQIMNTTW